MGGKFVYWFGGGTADGDGTMRTLLGGKGAGLADMARMGLPVPPGFTITTEAWSDPTGLDKVMGEVEEGLAKLEAHFGYMPLLSVRSGARVSMPGMMDTILNVGMGAGPVLDFWTQKLGERAALDCYRRFLMMFGTTAMEHPEHLFSEPLKAAMFKAKVTKDSDLPAMALRQLVKDYITALPMYPDKLVDQLRTAIKAVWNSWWSDRAKAYRSLHNISDAWGTAVTVQAMVFGNANDKSGSGVMFTRCPITGANKVVGEFLPNAQGEDVVAGIRTPRKLEHMPSLGLGWPEVHKELLQLAHMLEDHYRDAQDIEFTVQDQKVWLLQTRTAKREALAAFHIAHDLCLEGAITKAQAVARVSGTQYKVTRRPQVAPGFTGTPNYTGISGCAGIARGRAVLTVEAALQATDPVILVRHETSPDDIAAMAKAVGVLTKVGGFTSHAAVVARAMDKPCVVGCTQLVTADLENKPVVIDGGTGRVWVGVDVPVMDASEDPKVAAVVSMAMEAAGLLPAYKLGSTPTGPVVVYTADWHPDDFYNNAGKVMAVRDKVAYIDLYCAHVYLRDADQTFMDALGSSAHWLNAAVAREQRLIAALAAQGPWVGTRYVGATGWQKNLDDLAKLGFVRVSEAHTLADIQGGKPKAVGAAFIQQVAGTKAAWAAVKPVLVAAGYKIEEVPEACAPAEAAYLLLGKVA